MSDATLGSRHERMAFDVADGARSSYHLSVVILLLVALILVGTLTIGWRTFAAETSPRAATALLLMLAGVGLAVWLLSEASFDAGF